MAETKVKSPLRIDRIFNLNEFVSAVQANANIKSELQATGICLDTRNIESGDLFFAIQSTRDGHEFVGQAMQKGAVACVVSKDVGIENQIIVPDTLRSLWYYANWVRKSWGKKLVALSGSNGKTTTKEFLGTLLGPNTLKTPGTWNNFLGVPLTLLMLKDEHEQGVIEIGINHFGELLQLCRVVQPNVALLTNVGTAHLQELHDLNGVAKAKSEIFSQLEKKDIAVLNIDDEKIAGMRKHIRASILTVSQNQKADVFLQKKKKIDGGYELIVQYGEKIVDVHLPILGEHSISNFLCALGAAKALDIPAVDIVKRTALIRQVDMRMEIHQLSDRRFLVNDCYNANPGSFQAALQTVSEMKPKRFLVLMGDMLEMGSKSNEIHFELAKKFSGYHVDQLLVTGAFSQDVVAGAVQGGMNEAQIIKLEKKMDAVEKILSNFHTGDILLVKASRGIQLEEVIEELERRLKG